MSLPMSLRPCVAGLVLLAAALGCETAPAPVEPRVTRVVPDAPELRAALIALGWSAAAADAPAPVVRFADLVPPHGDEIVVAWERPCEAGGLRAAVAVHALDTRRSAITGLCFDASGDAFDGGAAGGVDVRDVTGDLRPDLVVRRRVGDDVAVTIYAAHAERFRALATARGHRVELRDLDGDRRVEVLVSREIGEGLRGFPEILRLAPDGCLVPNTGKLDAVMPDEARAYIEHVRAATSDPSLRALALRSAAEYLAGLGHRAEAELLEREASFVAPAPGDAAVDRRE